MNLIAKYKIAEYINENPQSRIDLLTWLKEYPYQRKDMFSNQEGISVQSCGYGTSSPGLGDYSIKYKINFMVKTILITWIGNKEEYKTEIDREIKEMQEKYSNLIVTKEVITISHSDNLNEPLEDEITETDLNTTFVSVDVHKKIVQFNLDNDLSGKQVFKTEADYKEKLAKVVTIFDSKPDTPGFDELLALLPLVKNYEDHQLKFPLLQVFEIVMYRLNMFGMLPRDLTSIVGSENEVNMFLSGKLTLPPEILSQLYKRLGIGFPVNDHSFLKNSLL